MVSRYAKRISYENENKNFIQLKSLLMMLLLLGEPNNYNGKPQVSGPLDRNVFEDCAFMW